MATAADIQSLLRFLSQDAKLPLPVAIGKVQSLQAEDLATTSAISKSSIATLKPIFDNDEKIAKQVLNAAKRAGKKRGATEDNSKSSNSSKRYKAAVGEPLTPAEIEEGLELPGAKLEVDELENIVLFSNRAPLVLAFAVSLLKFTMPSQPISSRLSLAQAVVSANSRSKAVSIGLESGKSADEEGWGEGQPVVRIMTREIRVMKRWGYEWNEKAVESGAAPNQGQKPDEASSSLHDEEPALWGLDLEAYKKSSLQQQGSYHPGSKMPIYTAESARNYLMRSFNTAPRELSNLDSTAKSKSSAPKSGELERNLGALLESLDMLFASWAGTLSHDELNRRAWSWYVSTRPEVEQGTAGWGGKGNIKLSAILALRKS